MAYVSKYSGEELDANLDLNITQNNQINIIQNKLDTIDIGANKFILTDNCITTNHIQDASITANKLTPEVSEALASIKTYKAILKASDWVDNLAEVEQYSLLQNKWKWERFPYQSSTLTSSIRSTLINTNPSEIKYINDTEITAGFDFGENYIARCTTYIYSKKAIDLTFTFSTDDDSCLYLNGVFVRSNPNTTPQTAVLQFKKGVNIVEVFYREITGGDG